MEGDWVMEFIADSLSGVESDRKRCCTGDVAWKDPPSTLLPDYRAPLPGGLEARLLWTRT